MESKIAALARAIKKSGIFKTFNAMAKGLVIKKIERERLLITMKMLRPDLTEDDVLKGARSIAKVWGCNTNYVLDDAIFVAMKGEPLPWEKDKLPDVKLKYKSMSKRDTDSLMEFFSNVLQRH